MKSGVAWLGLATLTCGRKRYRVFKKMLNLSTTCLLTLSAILLIAVIEDVRNHRISNSLVVCTFVLGTGFQILNSGFGLFNVGFVISGTATGFFALLPFYVLGGMGAGDVKLFAALGAFLGPFVTLYAVAMTLVIGALIATGVFTYRKYRIDPVGQEQENTSSKNIISFPYAPAIALGTIGTILIN